MTSGLVINLLGELEVRRGDVPLALPPSRKTRALLGYLVLGGRAFRREALCELLWDVADDPRAELRWSLSKLRGVLDEADVARIEAGRDDVCFRAHGANIDALELRRAVAARSLAALAIDDLERLAGRFRGELLEGLDLPDFDVYQAWCVAQREEARLARARVLAELVERYHDQPAQAVEHARARVMTVPHDLDARASLVAILGALGRRDEARMHYESGLRTAADMPRATSTAKLEAAWRMVESEAPAVAAGAVAPTAGKPASVASTPLVGRTAELATLDAALARVESTRRFAALAFTGALGSGKSRLLEAWLARARASGAAIASTTAFEADRGRPYGPWLDALARLPGSADRPGPQLAVLARTPAADLTSPADRDQLYEGVATTIADAAASCTIVLAIDDAHWLDAGAAALLAHIARRCDQLPVLAVLMARPGELDDNIELARALRGMRQLGAISERELPPLDREATAELVRRIGSSAAPELVFARSGGNPLFALELARTLASVDGSPPSSVATALRDRLATLPADAAQVLRWGAVLRRDVGPADLEALTELGPEPIVDALDLLCAHALLVRGDDARHTFSHELVRQVVYDALSEPRRRLMHRRVAESLAARLERGDDQIDVSDVAHHAAAAHDAALATRTCLTAARRSLRVFAVADAATLARRGLRHAEALAEPDRTQRSLELFEVALAARRPDDAERVATQVEALAERALDLGALEHARLGYHLLAYLRWDRGAWLDAQRHMRHAQMISRGAPEPEQIVGMAEAARCLVMLEKDLPEAQALALEAAARGRLAGVEPAATFVALGMLHLHRGQLAEARTGLERALAISRVRRDRHDEYQALEQLAALELACDDAAAARARADELTVLGARFGDSSEAPFACGLLALARMAAGDDADRELEASLDALATVDAKQRLAYLASRAAWHAAEHGHDVRAASRAARALAAAQALERVTETALAHGVLARTRPAEAEAHLAEVVARWPDIAADVRARLQPLVADRLRTRGDREEEP